VNSAKGTVFIVDDDPAIRRALGRLLEEVALPARTFATADAFLETYDEDEPGCLVLDVRMPGMSGMDLQERLNQLGIRIPIIFITAHGDIPMAVAAIQRGALDFVEKPVRAQKLIDRIHDALNLDVELRAERQKTARLAERFELLTRRERQVIELAATGQTNKEIATQFGVSSQAIDGHRSRAMKKLGTHSVAELVRLVLDLRGESNVSAPDPPR
jgi:two-component system response regulator FixJ